MSPIFFENQTEFRKWLEINHSHKTELLVGYYKVHTGKPSMTWSQSVDVALSFGWIDGIRRSVDKESYCIRFTPRNPDSNWSETNIRKAEELIKQGLMHPKGLALYHNRKKEKSGIYSYENKPGKLPPESEKLFRENKDAWEFFSQLPDSYRKTVYFWILDAKQESTRLSRLKKSISASELKKRVF
jgi:uncharacterized protein YdeI (YjbR/CyaY-like superfamily)